MGELQTVVGKNGGIEEKASGWFEIKVLVPGKQYPVKLATKRSSLVDAVRNTKGEVATFSYNETESERINENTGKPYINRYLEGVEIGGSTSSNSGGTAGGNGRENVDWDAKERRDFRSRAWAQTLSTFEHTISKEEDVALVFARLKPFQQMVYEDVVGELAEVKQPDPPAASDEPPHDDSDIPFLWIDNYELEPVTVRDHYGRTASM